MTSMDNTFETSNQNISNRFQVNFFIEKYVIIQKDNEMLIDPFNAHWKKVLGTVSYILQVFGGLFVLAFIRYETQGHAAHFRTALNQITSWIALVVSNLCLLY